ncbi:MAG: aminopeptidase [Bacilli bacterium]|nr:aminopeptidase [Bacilli bacterium]
MYKQSVWKKYNGNYKEIMDFAEDYKDFISFGKTERLCVKKTLQILEEKGFVDVETKKDLKPGDKVYSVNKNKNVAIFVIGKKPLNEGLRILGAHIDSPRMDLKQNPLYEKEGFALLDTHYYGGIKKYQWVTIPLALHGVVCKKDGSTIEVSIGEEPNDPVLGIGDLLIHLSADQMQKTAAKLIEGEDLDVTVGSIPELNADKVSVKQNILRILKEKYDFEEEDFLSAEIEVVPAGQARDYGLDRSMVAGYGHDDRSCAYTSLRAVVDTTVQEYTTCCILVDKEEIGSVGATGAQSLYFENLIAKLCRLAGSNEALFDARLALANSKMLSSDVSAGVDPLFLGVNEMKNACHLGEGIVFNKYTGSRGKSGSNDANPEFIAWVREALDSRNVCFQTAELGRVDQGGGGTIAYILGNYDMNVLDGGIAVLNMHAPMEIVSKADVYEAYVAYKAFLEA